MDPSIMKLLEEDEDESMHSGADVEAFQAALNRDIGGDTSISQPTGSDSDLVQGKDGNNSSNHLMTRWQNASLDENKNFHSQQGLESARQQEQHSQQMELQQHGSVAETQQQQNDSSASEEHNSHNLQQKKSQDDLQQGQAEDQIATQIPQTTGIHISDKNPVPIREQERIQNQVGESQYSKLQKMSNQQTIGAEQASNPMNRGKQVPFALLLPALVPHLDKDRAMQLHTLYGKLKKNEIVKDVFVRHMRDIVGDQMLRMAVNKMQSQMGANQFQLQSQASARQQQLRVPSVSAGATQFSDAHSFAQHNQKGSGSSTDPVHVPPSSVQVQAGLSHPIKENNAKKSRDLEHQSGSHGIHASQMPSSTPSTVNQEHSSISVQGLNKQQQQHLHFPQTSFSMYGSSGGNYHPYSGANVASGSSMKPHPHDPQMRQITHHQSMGSTPSGGASQPMNMINVPKFERQNSINNPCKVQGGSVSHFTNNSTLQQNSAPWQASANKEQSSGPLSSLTYVKPEPVDQGTDQQPKLLSSAPQGLSTAQAEQGNTIPGTLKDDAFERQSPRMGFSTSSSIVPSNSVSPSSTTQLDPNVPLSSRSPSVTSPAGVNARTPPKKPSVGQKKPLEPPGSSPPLPSKKQKVSGAFSDQSIEQLNDVTAVSGVNLREEEEQLFSGPKEDSRVSEASRRVVQEEEERLILQKTPLQKKLAEIMAKCGLKNMSNDVERCLSLCVEERMRTLLCNLIRLSKQRADAEKTRHRTVITSDIRQQIMLMNQKAREEWEKKQAEAEKLRKLSEPEGVNDADGDKEKDDGRAKSVKANKEEDDKMRATAANVAARAAVGGDDMLSKWQLMAEQARQKREGGMDAASGSLAGKDANRKPLSTSGRNMKDNQEAEKRSQAASIASGTVRKFGRNQVIVPQTKVARAISVKDVIAVLEREPQMSKSTLVYRLYEKIRSDAAAE